MRKIFLSSFVFAVIILMSSCLFAAFQDSNTGLYTFDSKVMALWISYDSGSTWYEIFNYDLADAVSVDVATGDAGSQMGTFFSGRVIPTGTITHFKVRIPWSCNIKGWVKSGTHYYVTDNTVANTQTRDFGTSQPSESDCTTIALSGPPGQGDYQDQTNEVSGGGIVVADSATVNVSIRFNLGAALTVADYGGGYVITPSDNFAPTISQI